MSNEKQKWLITHDSHDMKKGEVFTGDKLPPHLVGKARLVSGALAGESSEEVEKLLGELTSAQEKIASLETSAAELTADNAKLREELDAATKRVEELTKKAK